ncbi:MAG TPA: NADH-quinone oxidoreductase subunit M [Bryobacteraceae bacterium]|nr:NADH-quinone oxidoreductase subunit M [Bryobacteraceae bacterium]HPT27474.1 NADH-quinone oxidoreductase subunit M [Bryobacteraceae bacterium]
MTLLDAVLFLPAIGFIIGLLLPRDNISLIRNYTIAVSLLVFIVSLGLIGPVLANPGASTLITDTVWIEYPAIRYHVALDGLSLWLVILTTLLTPICVLISWKYIQTRAREFYAFLLLLEFGLIGVFVALDLFLFYVFWEVSLVPMYFLIGIWGHEKRIYAAVKFFLYTLTGSLLMLAGIIWLYNKSGTFDLLLLTDMIQKGRLALTSSESFWLFLAFFFAFAIKVPLFPLHTWLPDAHGEAPTAGSVMLASVMLKMGTYAIVRVCLPLFPEASRQAAPYIITLAIIGIIYGALVAMVQPNMKRLVAYSSVSHLGFVILGIFTFTQTGMDGAVYQMLNHGVSTGALFILVGYLYERRHSLEIADFGGVGTVAPWLSTVFVITTLASVGLPLLNNFIGEFLVLQAAMQVNILYAVFAAVGVILSAVYMLWMVQRTFYGETPAEVKHHVFDMTGREWAAMLPLLVLMVWMGIGTQSFLPSISANNVKTLELVQPPGTAVRAQASAAKPATEVSDAR